MSQSANSTPGSDAMPSETGMSEHVRQALAKARATIRPLLPARMRGDVPIVPVVRLAGAIGISSPMRPGLTLANTAKSLDRAFSTKHAKAVALVINSPGGSAVQSHLIFQRIRALSTEKKLPVLAFVEDAAASGGYMIACAADEIFADPSSIVGSIGVIGGSFGLDKLIARFGIERRIYTAGENKSSLDPFLPEDPEDVARLKAIQDEIHQTFIALVRDRRGERLVGPEKALFSGEYWGGERARLFGLIDGLGEVRTTLRERFGDKVMMPLVVERGFFGRKQPGVSLGAGLGNVSALFGGQASLAEDILAAVESRTLWGRYGL